MQYFEHRGAKLGTEVPAGIQELSSEEPAGQLTAEAGEQQDLDSEELAKHPTIEVGGRRVSSEELPTQLIAEADEWEQEMLSRLDTHQAAEAANSEQLPSSEEVELFGDRRYPQRARSQPVRYGDWNGNSVNWVKEVVLTLDRCKNVQPVSDSARTQLISDATMVGDYWDCVDLDCCEWAVSDGPYIFAVSASTSGNVLPDPLTLTEALSRPDGDRWKAAADSEIESLLQNKTWDLVQREDWMKVLPCKWILKLKTDSQGLPDRYKGRVVVGGHRQVYGIDYDETFASVSKGTTHRRLSVRAPTTDGL
jgi:hypothetical protein